MTVAAQINVRIDAASKAKGDAGIAAAGLSTSEVVRAVWEVCAQYQDSPKKLKAWLSPFSSAKQADAQAKEKARKAQLIEEGATSFARLCADQGIALSDASGFPSDEELEAMALAEEFGSEMGMTQKDFLEVRHA